jgi:hypothetical protein
MSTALAIAGVTQVLRDLLNDRFVNQNVAGTLGQSVTVSTLPPDKVVKQNGVEVTQLNLFLRHVTPNIGWRNEGLPSRDVSGRTRLSNPPLALNLHYLISAYGAADLHAEILLGYAMQMLHECPVLTRESIRTALNPAPDAANVLPDWLRALSESGLEHQVEQIRVTPEFLSTEEMSKFWTSTLSHYRPSAGYQASVVLIQAQQPRPAPLPVLVRNIQAIPELAPPVPTLSAVVPGQGRNVVELGTTVTLPGFALQSTATEIVLVNDRFEIEEVLTPTGGTSSRIEFVIPTSRAADFPAGIYRVCARVTSPGETRPRTTNELALTIAPQITNLPLVVTRVSGTANVSLNFTPALRIGQVPRLMLAGAEHSPQAFTAPASTLTFSIPAAPVGNHLARLRIDGIDSPIVDSEAKPPAFLDRRIDIQ